jgi:hypothetical protein
MVSVYHSTNCRLKFRTLEELLFQLSLCDFDFNGFINLLVVAALVVGVVFDGCGEEGVDEGGLS